MAHIHSTRWHIYIICCLLYVLSVHFVVLSVKNVYSKTDRGARMKVSQNGMILVGWFHSHPTQSYYPSVYDVECQMNYQLRLRDQPIVSCIIGGWCVVSN